MTQLLISVRDSSEARVAVAAGVSILDVKEPRHGSLGAATEAAVVEILADKHPVPMSLAMGELFGPTFIKFSKDTLAQVDFVKVGLAGSDAQNWQERLLQLKETIALIQNQFSERSKDTNGPQLVAVAYADWQRARSPSTAEVLEFAISRGINTFLIDTFVKDGANLLTHHSLDEISRLIARAHAFNIRIALAGSLDQQTIIDLLPLAPDIIAVRGAACASNRESSICSQKTQQIKRLLQTDVAQDAHVE